MLMKGGMVGIPTKDNDYNNYKRGWEWEREGLVVWPRGNGRGSQRDGKG